MTPIFLFGTLRHLPLLEAVLGRRPRVAPALAEGHVVKQAQAGPYPVMIPGPGQAPGCVLLDVTAQDIARLDYYEAGYAYRLAPLTVLREGQALAASAYMPAQVTPCAADWDFEDWCRTWGPIAVEAAPEIMRAYSAGLPAAALAPRMAILRARAHATVQTAKTDRTTSHGGRLTRDDVTVEKIAYPYEAFFRVEDFTLSHSTHSGQRLGPLRRAVFNVCDAVTVLPYDPVRDRVLLVEQMRVGAFARGDPRPWMLEPVAGMIDAGETPQAAALREAEEEAGLHLEARNLHQVASYYPSPGGVAQRLISFVATCDLPDHAAGLGGEAAEDEDILSHLVSREALIAMVASGEAANAPLIISAQWLALHAHTLRA